MSTPMPVWETLRVSVDNKVCTIQLYRPEANNTINALLVEECAAVLANHTQDCNVVVIKGLPEVFCFGADFQSIAQSQDDQADAASWNPQKMYELWTLLATGPFVSIAALRGKANAGGVGFAAACDICLADESAVFSLSELLFGVYPACVLPFLARRIGVARASYMTLATQPVGVQQALAWGLVDACESNLDVLLRRHVQRLQRLKKSSIQQFKAYAAGLAQPTLQAQGEPAVAANREAFSDAGNLRDIRRYVQEGVFPWEAR